MRVLQIIYSLASGGAERFVVDLSNELLNQGQQVHLVTLRDDNIKNNGFYKSELDNSVEYCNLKIPEGFSLKIVWKLYVIFRKIQPEVVHCHLDLVNYIFPLALYFRKIKFIYTVHSDASKELKKKSEYFLRRLFFSTGLVQAVTISQATSYSFRSFYKTNSFIEIYNGRSTPLPTVKYEEIKTLLYDYKRKGVKILIHIGRFSKIKNQKVLIDAFNELYFNGYKFILLMIGAGFECSDGENLKKIACPSIWFLGEKKNVADYLYNAEAFCLTSKYEGMPISLLEAFATGCVPICTPVGGIVSVISHGENGFLSQDCTSEAFVKAVKLYLNDNTIIDKTHLISYFKSHFSIAKCTQRYLEVYNENIRG